MKACEVCLGDGVGCMSCYGTGHDRDEINALAEKFDECSKCLQVRNASYLNHGIYRHYKGKLYYLLTVGHDAGSKPDRYGLTPRSVFYMNLLPDEYGWRYMYRRPYDEFTAKVNHEGEEVDRFVWLGYRLGGEPWKKPT